MFTSKAQQFLMLELYLYTRTTCFGQLVTIFRSLTALIYIYITHMLHIIYKSSQGPEDGHNLTETRPSIEV